MKELIKKLNLEDFFRIIKNDKFEYAGGFKGFPELKIGLLDSYLKFKKKIRVNGTLDMIILRIPT